MQNDAKRLEPPLVDYLHDAICMVEADMADDAADAEETGERVDLHEYCVEIPIGAAKQILAELTRTPAPAQPADVDSGMSGPQVERAEVLWANLPTGREWTSLATHEKALACHVFSRAALAAMPAIVSETPSDVTQSVLRKADDHQADAQLVTTARKNLPHFINAASFGCEVDRQAALKCVEVLSEEIDGLNDLAAVLRSAFAAASSLTPPAERLAALGQGGVRS